MDAAVLVIQQQGQPNEGVVNRYSTVTDSFQYLYSHPISFKQYNYNILVCTTTRASKLRYRC